MEEDPNQLHGRDSYDAIVLPLHQIFGEPSTRRLAVFQEYDYL